MAEKFTQGEWYWTTNDAGKPHNLRSKLGNLDKHIFFVGDDFQGNYSFTESAKANARLISQAPAMYEALGHIKSTWIKLGFGIPVQLLEEIDAVLAKIEEK